MALVEGSVRRRIQRLAAMGEYELAEELVQHNRAQHELALSTAARQLEKEAAHEWDALQSAKAEHISQCQCAAVDDERRHYDRLLRVQAERCQADEEELARFATAEMAKLSTMPVAVPRQVLALQQQETQLRWEGSFGAAAQRRRDAARLQREMFGATWASRGSLLDQRISRQAAALLTRETVALEKDDASVAALQAKHARQHQRTAAQLHRVEAGMLAAQRRALRHVQETRACDGLPSAAVASAHRGTELEKRVYGDSYRLPSLCRLYGPLLEERASALPPL